jgi:hypothetical protein
MVFGALRGAQNRMAVFDSCRNNPADGALQLETERAASQNVEVTQQKIAENPNTLSLFSTSPGHVALDGAAGDNSPFAAALMRQLDAAQIDLNALAPRLRRDLLIATQGRQMLWDMNGFKQSFVLKGPSNPPAARMIGDPSRALELRNAYAFAQQNGFFVPAGLVAYRTANAADARKIGSFKFDNPHPSGTRPQLFIVLSVQDNRALVLQAGSTETIYWSLRLANVAGNKIDLVPRAGAPRFTFDFNDANSGTVTLVAREGQGGGGPGQGGPGSGPPQQSFRGGGGGGGFGPAGGGGRPGGSPGGAPPGGGTPAGSRAVQFTRLD